MRGLILGGGAGLLMCLGLKDSLEAPRCSSSVCKKYECEDHDHF